VILIETRPSVRDSVENLISFAKKNHFDTIVVSTHARKGMPRLFLGSFAETLLLRSSIPVISINPTAHAPEKISKIAFPTDFSQASRRGFEAAVAVSRHLEAKLFLYYKTPQALPMAYPETPILYQYIAEAEAQLEKTGQAWTDWAQKQQADIKLVFDKKPGAPSQGILDFAKTEGIELISMISQIGPVASAIIGSTTRQVLRHAECPVWVQHAH
jgi:nucleotide-binding universal stress UspA family protein